MAFLNDRESIILMDCPLVGGAGLMPVDDLKAFADAGIRTAYWAGPSWDAYVSDDLHTFRPAYFDDYLNRIHKAGLKAIIPLWHKQNTHYPNDYYVRREGGYVIGMFSPWNKEAQEKAQRLFIKVRDEYTSDTVLFTTGQADGGERVLMNKPAYFDDNAVKSYQARCGSGKPSHTSKAGAAWLKESYIKLLLDQQRLCVEGKHHEIWFQLSPYKVLSPQIEAHGCEWIADYLESWKVLQPASVNHIIFNYFGMMKSAELYKMVAREKDTFGVNEFVGAEYCEGLSKGNGRLAFEHGLRGLIVGPLHPFTKHKKVEPWMLATIKETVKLFEGRRR